MTEFLIRRFFQSIVALVVISIVVFIAIYAIGDPVSLLIDPDASTEERAEVSRQLGLDKPLYSQYLIFVGGALKGDLGHSFVYNIPAIKLILTRLPATLELACFAILLAIVGGIPLGLVAGILPNGWISRTIMTGSIFGFSLPSFWVGLMMIMIFSIQLTWLPTIGRGETLQVMGVGFSFLTVDGLRHLILPAINLALYPLSLVIRLTKAGVQETATLEFVRFARAKGLPTYRVVFVHILKNILIPIITVIGVQFGTLLAFAVVTESVFAWPGMGKLIIDSINLLDRPVIVAYLLITVLMFLVINMVVDLLYSLIDPRIRISGMN
jgi:peptide/nickel transport system permease protein